jgi:arginase family enzyme
VLSGISSVHPHDRIGLLYFDGDADLTVPATAGTGGMTGILDSMVMTHLTQREGGLQSMKSFAKPDGSPLVTNENVVLFGLDPNQPGADHWAFLAEGGFKVFSRPTVSRNPKEAALKALTWLESNVDKIVVHFDLDVIDSGKFPIGNYPHYAGLEFKEAMTALRVFVGSGKLLALVVTEVNPNNDPSGRMLEMLVDGIVKAFSGRQADN